MDNPQKPPKPQPPFPQQPRPFDWRLLLWVVMAVLISSWVFNQQRGGAVTTLAYSEFKQDIRQDKVASITVKGQQVFQTFKIL